MKKEITVFCDGGAINNPGPAGIGVVFREKGGTIFKKISRFIGKATNNQAEYQAIVLALQEIKKIKPTKVRVFLDSQLIVEQINHRYKIKNEGLAPYFIQVHNLKISMPNVKFYHIPREKNKIADSLVKEAIKKHVQKSRT